MIDVCPGYSAPQRKLDCIVALTGMLPAMRVHLRNVMMATTGFGALLGAQGCSMTPNNLPPAPPTPAPDSGYVSTLQPYRIQVGDILDVRLMLNPELNEEITVRPDGHISTT